jgi:hypothetical protein
MNILASVTKAFETPYLYFTVVSLTVGLFTFYFWTRRLKWMFGQLRRKWKIEPYDPRLLQYYKNAVWLWSFFFAVGCLMLTFAFYLTTYQFIGSKVEPAGQAVVSASRVEYLGSDGVRITASWKGNQVAAAGMFISFPRWMRYIGLENYHRMLTFRGNGEHDFHYGKIPEPS